MSKQKLSTTKEEEDAARVEPSGARADRQDLPQGSSEATPTPNKPDCYACVHRREVPGSAHSACSHPLTEGTRRSPFMQLAGVVGKRGGDQLSAMAQYFDEGPNRAMRQLNITAHAHGVRQGWFVWPVNFDPTWLLTCDGFTAKAEGVA